MIHTVNNVAGLSWPRASVRPKPVLRIEPTPIPTLPWLARFTPAAGIQFYGTVHDILSLLELTQSQPQLSLSCPARPWPGSVLHLTLCAVASNRHSTWPDLMPSRLCIIWREWKGKVSGKGGTAINRNVVLCRDQSIHSLSPTTSVPVHGPPAPFDTYRHHRGRTSSMAPASSLLNGGLVPPLFDAQAPN